MGLISRIKRWVDGEILYASDLNAEIDNIIDSLAPSTIDDCSSDQTAMDATSDPYPGGTADKAQTLAEEIQQIRYLIAQITGESKWYIDPDSSIAALATSGVTFSTALPGSQAIGDAGTAGTATTPARIDHKHPLAVPKLDDLGSPDDNTDLNVTTAAHGLCPKLSGTAASYLNGTGGWATPASASAASESAAGVAEIATHAETDAGSDDSRIVTPHKLYETPGIYRKNVIINGDMAVWQRGTSFAALADGGFCADRWALINGTDAVMTLSKSTNVPTDAQGNGRFAGSLQVDVTTADTSIGATQASCIQYKVEGYDIRQFVGQNMTLSFWVAATKPGTYCVVFVNSGSDKIYPVTYTINSADTWEKKTIVVPMTECGAGTWDFTNGIGLRIRFVLAAGSSYANGTNATWGTTGLYGVSGQVNGLDSASNFFLLTGVQLEKGSVATQFEYRAYQIELALCQRYYEKIGAVQYSPYCHSYIAAGSVGAAHNIWFRVTKRTTPTVDVIGTWTVNNCGQPDAYYPSRDSCCLIAVSSGAGMVTFYPADATCYVTVSAEL